MGEQAVNEYQKAVAGTYGGGDFAHVADAATAKDFWKAVDGCGDSMFKPDEMDVEAPPAPGA